MAFAAAALYFGAAGDAFAHPAHHHIEQAQSTPAVGFDHSKLAIEKTERTNEFVSAAQPQTDKCPHGQGSNCEFCCPCAAGASVALVTAGFESVAARLVDEAIAPDAPYQVRKAVLDLSRPPKSFA